MRIVHAQVFWFWRGSSPGGRTRCCALYPLQTPGQRRTSPPRLATDPDPVHDRAYPPRRRREEVGCQRLCAKTATRPRPTQRQAPPAHASAGCEGSGTEGMRSMTLSTGERASACDSGRVKDRKSTTAVAISAKPNPAPGSFAAPKGMPAAAAGGRERNQTSNGLYAGKLWEEREDQCFHREPTSSAVRRAHKCLRERERERESALFKRLSL